LHPNCATLDGTVLSTENGRCDLATAAGVRICVSISQQGPGDFFNYLEAWQGPGQPPVRLLLAALGWFPVAPEHLRMLAAIIEARPGQPDKQAQRAVVYLRNLAGRVEYQSQPIDWSFRAGPMTDRRTGPGEYHPP
jgi:hypothetical protein